MFIKSTVELIYVSQSVAENGSPVELTYSQTVKCDEMETFSNYYYNDQQRNMRISRNLVIPTHYCDDIILTDSRYELMYCNYDGRKYKIRNILKMKGTRTQMILDCEEVR